MSHITNPKIGQVVRFRRHEVAGNPPKGFRPGQQATITDVSDTGRFVSIDIDPSVTPFWSVEWFEDADPEAPARPQVITNTRTTARKYALSLISRANHESTNAVLDSVARGEPVDVYELNRAAFDAVRRINTRVKGSAERKEMASRAAHLAHIAHAVIENHADGLPAYAEGERSRRIEELERQLAEEKAGRLTAHEVADERGEALSDAQERAQEWESVAKKHQSYIQDLEAAIAEAKSELDKSTEFMEAKERQLQAAQTVLSRFAEERSAREAERADLEADVATMTEERDTLAAVVAYALERIEDPAEQQRIFGFWDGVMH